MDGIHDMGGMHGFGRVHVPVQDEKTVLSQWERRAHAMVYALLGAGVGNVDAFRHAIERVPPVEYLSVGYYGRWLRALETLLVAQGLVGPDELPARMKGARPGAAQIEPRESLFGVFREIDDVPRFGVGARVRAKNLHPEGHARLPGYVRGKCGVVGTVHPACVLPDTHAHGEGECPEYLFSVRFTADELWGEAAESAAPVSVDLFDRYLEPA